MDMDYDLIQIRAKKNSHIFRINSACRGWNCCECSEILESSRGWYRLWSVNCENLKRKFL